MSHKPKSLVPIKVILKIKSSHKSSARKGMKHIGGYFAPEISKQLRRIALEEDSSLQNLLAEAIDMIFQSRQKTINSQKPKIEHE